MSAGTLHEVPSPPRVDAVERSRTYRTPVKPTSHAYEEVVPAKRPGPGLRGVPFELKVNWFRVRFTSRPIYIYEVKVESGRKTREGLKFEKISDKVTISTLVYKAIHEYHDVFIDPWRFFFDDYEYIFTPDLIKMGRGNSLTLHVETSGERRKKVRIFIKQFVKFNLALRTPGSVDDNDAKWSSIFIKLLLSQNARFIPPELRRDHNTSIHARFAHLDGGMYFIPRMVDHDKDTAIKRKVQPGVEAWMGFYMTCRQIEDGDPVIEFGKTNKFFMSLNLNLLEFYKGVIEARDRKPIYLSREHVMSPLGIDDFTARLCGVRVRCDWVPDKDKNDNVIGKIERQSLRFVRVMSTSESADNYYMNVFNRLTRRRERVRMDVWYANQTPSQMLQYPKLPLCEVTIGKKKHYLPMEMLYIRDQPQKFTKQLDAIARIEIAEKLKSHPNEHHKYTTEMVSKKMEYDTDPYLKAMGFEIEKEMVECTGRVMNKSGIIKQDESGNLIAMNAETGEYPLKSAYETTEKEVIFVVCRATERIREDDIMSFYRGLVEKCKSRGLRVSQKETFHATERSKISPLIEKGLEFLDRRKSKENEILVFLFFLSAIDDECYGEIKLLSDLYHGVVTQVITERSVLKMKTNHPKPEELGDYNSIYHNIWLKLNVKLGGVNQVVDFSGSSEPEYDRLPTHNKTMFIGIDVIHPSPNSPVSSFSLASIVASVDRNAAKYVDRVMVNRNCNETIQHFEEHFAPLLTEFNKERGHLPERVVILRDGVSDSEMIMAASRELQSIKQTWRRCANGVPLPQFTYIVVQKRHRTRFYRRDVQENNANPFPGTVVSTGAVSPHKFDFYMISHHTPSGTSRPAHYTVVVDESNSSTDEITEMCFRLCCLYARCNKPVSIPSPVFYAHLRCKRAAIQFRHAVRTGELTEIDDIRTGETEQQYKERVEKHAMVIERKLNRDFNEPKKYPGMHYV